MVELDYIKNRRGVLLRVARRNIRKNGIIKDTRRSRVMRHDIKVDGVVMESM